MLVFVAELRGSAGGGGVQSPVVLSGPERGCQVFMLNQRILVH